MGTVGEAEGGTNGESSVNKHTLPCVKRLTSGKLLYSTGSSAQYAVMTYRVGWGWKEGLRGRGYMYAYS